MGSFPLGTIWAVLALKDQLGGPMIALAKTVKDSSGNIGTSVEGVGVKIGNVNKLIRDFSGLPLMNKAEEMAAAVQKIGGAAKLTADEQARVNAVVNEAIRKYQALGQEAPQHLKDLAVATTHVAQASEKHVEKLTLQQRIQQHVNAESKIAVSGIRDMALGYVTGQAAIAGFTAIGRNAVEFMKESVSAALEAELTQRKLTQALQQQGQAMPSVLKLYEQLANKYQSTTTFSNGLIAEQQVLLTQVGGVLPREMDSALKAVTNLSAGLGTDLKSATMMVSKAFEDNFASLGKAGVQINETRAKAEGMTYVLDQINAKFGGQAQAELDTYSGKLKQLANDYDALKEQIGTVVIGTGFLDHALMLSRVQIILMSAALEGAVNWVSALGTAAKGGFSTTAIARGLAQIQNHADGAEESLAELMKRVEGFGRGLDGREAPQQSKAQEAYWASQGAKAQQALDAQKKLLAAQAEEIRKLILVSHSLQMEVDKNVAGFNRFGGEAGLLTIDLVALATRLDDLHQKGAVLPPSVEAIRQKYVAWFRDMRPLRLEVDLLNNTIDRTAEIARRRDFFQDMAARGAIVGTMNVTLQQQANVTQQIVKPTEDWDAALESVVTSFESLANISGGGGLSSVARGIGSALATTKLLRQSWSDMSSAKTFSGTLSGLAGVAGAITQGIGLAVELGKALHDAFTRSEAEKAAADIRRNFGVMVDESSAVARNVEKMVKDLGIDRNLAIDLSLPDIIREGGGLNAQNFASIRDRANELFDDIQLGGEVGRRAMVALDQTMGQLGAHVVAQGGLWDQHFVEMLRRAQAEGLELASVAQIIRDELDKLGPATTSVAKGLAFTLGNAFTSFAPSLTDSDVATLLNKVTNSESLTRSEQQRFDRIAQTNAKVVANYQEEFDRVSRITLAAFNAEVANGTSAADAVRHHAGAINELIAASERYGFAGNEAYGQLARWSNLVEFNGPLLDQVSSLSTIMQALANTGGLTAQAFADIQAQGASAFAQLTEAGFTEQEALAQIAPMLETVLQLHKDRGYAIDDETQALIDQAREAGVLAEEQIDYQQLQLDLTAALVEAVGGQLPLSFLRARDAARTAASGIQDSFSGLDLTVPVNFDVEEQPRITPDVPQLRGGTRGRYPDWGTGTLVELHGRERVSTEEEGRREAAPAPRATHNGIVPIIIAGKTVGTVLMEDLLVAFERNDGGGAPVGPAARLAKAIGVSS